MTAGYCLYSSSTIFVVTTRNGVYGFTLDPLLGEFILSHDNVKVSHHVVTAQPTVYPSVLCCEAVNPNIVLMHCKATKKLCCLSDKACL